MELLTNKLSLPLSLTLFVLEDKFKIDINQAIPKFQDTTPFYRVNSYSLTSPLNDKKNLRRITCVLHITPVLVIPFNLLIYKL